MDFEDVGTGREGNELRVVEQVALEHGRCRCSYGCGWFRGRYGRWHSGWLRRYRVFNLRAQGENGRCLSAVQIGQHIQCLGGQSVQACLQVWLAGGWGLGNGGDGSVVGAGEGGNGRGLIFRPLGKHQIIKTARQ